ncbi:MAG: 7-cyano-7-deazaguanine synthase QueC [Gammaproteobacteria bacterium]|nr:7-cyano-7-deazaguanine synthase QueC [Gammaproteobacteria bacterium]
MCECKYNCIKFFGGISRVSSKAKKAVILFSGGLDSTTVLAQAQMDGFECYAMSFDYSQRHSVELASAKKIAANANVAEHKIIKLDLAQIGGSALTDLSIDVPVDELVDEPDGSIPVTYVPARNTIFLSIALGWAEVIGANHIFVGVNAVDYSGYPDCRPEYIEAFEKMANLATKVGVEEHSIHIETPLIDLTKAEITQLGISLGIDYSQTVSCYLADEDGKACGVCDSCRLRRQGFKDADIYDPTRYQ